MALSKGRDYPLAETPPPKPISASSYLAENKPQTSIKNSKDYESEMVGGVKVVSSNKRDAAKEYLASIRSKSDPKTNN